MNLIPRNEAKEELSAAYERVKAAKRAMFEAWEELSELPLNEFYSLDGQNAYRKVQDEFQGALEWFGECYYQTKKPDVPDLAAALQEETELRGMVVELYAKLGTVDGNVLSYVVDTAHELNEARQKVYALLAQYAEGWYSNG